MESSEGQSPIPGLRLVILVGRKRMTANIRLRPIVEADREFLYRCYASTRAEELSVLDWSDETKEEFLRM